MHSTTTLGLAVLICGCSNGPPPAENGGFKLEDVVRTSDDGLRMQLARREVPLHEMPVASVLGGLPMTVAWPPTRPPTRPPPRLNSSGAMPGRSPFALLAPPGGRRLTTRASVWTGCPTAPSI